MSELVVLRDLGTRTVETRPNYNRRRLLAAGMAFVGLSIGLGITANAAVDERLVCDTAPASTDAWQSGQDVATYLESQGVLISDVSAVTSLVSSPEGGENICGTAYKGLHGLAGIDSIIHSGANIHKANG